MSSRWPVLLFALLAVLSTILVDALHVSVSRASELVHGSSAISLMYLFELKRGDVSFYPVLVALLADDSAAVQTLYETSCRKWIRQDFHDLFVWARLHLPQSSLLWNALFSPAAMSYVPTEVWGERTWLKLIDAGIPSGLSLIHNDDVSVEIIKTILAKPAFFPALERHCAILYRHPSIFSEGIDLVSVLHSSCLSRIPTTILFGTLKDQIANAPMVSLSRLILSMQGLSLGTNPALRPLEDVLRSRICKGESNIDCPVARLNALALKCSKDRTSPEMALQQVLFQSQLSDSQLLTLIELLVSKKLIPIKKIVTILRTHRDNSYLGAVGPLEVGRLVEILVSTHSLADGRAIMAVLGHDFNKILLLTSSSALRKPAWLKRIPEKLRMAWYRRRRLHLGRRTVPTSPFFEDHLEAGYNGVGLASREQFLSYLRTFIGRHLDVIALTEMGFVRPRLLCNDSRLLEALFNMLTLGKIRYGQAILPVDPEYCELITDSIENVLRSELFQADVALEARGDIQEGVGTRLLEKVNQNMTLQFLAMNKIYEDYSIVQWFANHDDLCHFLQA